MIDGFQDEQTVKSTRKVHQCYECRTPIDKGSEAVRISGRWDGAFFSNHSHPDCYAASIHYFREAGLDAYEPWPGIQEELSQFGTKDSEFTGTLEMFRENGWGAVADRLMVGREND